MHGLDEQLRPSVLQQKASGAGPKGAVDVLVEVEGRDHHHRYRVRDAPPGEELRHLDAVEPGHPDVDEADVGVEPSSQLDRGVAVDGLTDDVDVGLCVKDHGEAGTHQVLVVGHQHAHRHRRTSIGNSASTVHPPPDAGPARNVPPSSCTRSVIPSSPKPWLAGRAGSICPSSVTRSRSLPSPSTTRISTREAFRACRRAFVSASCASRYTAASTWSGSSSRSPGTSTSTTGTGSRRARDTRSATPGWGVYSAGAPSRSTRTIARISASVRDASPSMTESASSAASGRCPANVRPACACTAIAETWWATVSCSSRARPTRSWPRTWSSARRRLSAR